MPTVPSDKPKKHVSATERFTDNGFKVVKITSDMALKAIGVDVDAPLIDKKAMAQAAYDNFAVAPALAEALKRDGYVTS